MLRRDLLLFLVASHNLVKEFRDHRVLLSTIGTVNFATTTDTAAAALFPKHIQRQFVIAKGAFHDRIPVISRN